MSLSTSVKYALSAAVIAVSLFGAPAHAANVRDPSPNMPVSPDIAALQKMFESGAADKNAADLREKEGCKGRVDLEQKIANGDPNAETYKNILNSPNYPTADACQARAQREQEAGTAPTTTSSGAVVAVQPVAPVRPVQ